WYHIGVYWKGTRWAHLAMLVDGFAHPQATFAHVTPQGVPMITELAGPLPAPKAGDPPTTPLSLRNGGWIPQPPPNELPPIQPEPPLPAVPTEPNYIPLLIGDEVVHLDLAKRTVWRGMRGTTSRDHPAGVKVQLFGYSSKLRPLNLRRGGVMAQFNKLPATAGQIDLDFDANPSASVVGDKSDATGRFVDSSQDFVQATSVDDFPERGYIKIDNEVIYYDALERGGTPRFAKCQRAQEKTTAARHDDGAVIECWCVPVTSTRGYLSPTFIQVEEEWFGPVKIADGRPNFWVGVSVGSPPLPDPFSRAIEGSRRTAHRRGENVIPVFAVADSDPGVNRLNCQRWDRVTLVDGADSRVSARVRRSTGVSNVLQLVALWEPVKRDYLPDEQHVRLLKWPSGELLSLSWLQNADPQVSFGPGGIMIDEVKFLASPKGPFATSAVTDSSTRLIRMNGVSALGTEGAIKVGDEIIGYADVDAKSGELRECSRGWLNSRADVHAQGEPAFNMSFLPISCLSAGVGAQDRAFTVRSPLEGGYRPGYALIDEEVVGFENFSNMATGAVYECSPDVQGQVLWRGRFGTAAQSHAQDALVYGIPSRYWDTYRPQQFDDEMAYFQASITRRGARWRTVQWQQEVPQDDPLVRTHCLVRADGMGEFTDAPVRDGRTQLWDFTTPNAPNAIDYVSGRRDAGQLDARFYVEYLPGAYWPNHAWKRSPKIQRLQVEMERPTRVLYHEDD
ncbi:MAG: hypothetical protein HYY16_06305, partial [Planctomycetes bacterium]|nr:hypothetical protein [Planctomycetota bacterium]